MSKRLWLLVKRPVSRILVQNCSREFATKKYPPKRNPTAWLRAADASSTCGISRDADNNNNNNNNNKFHEWRCKGLLKEVTLLRHFLATDLILCEEHYGKKCLSKCFLPSRNLPRAVGIIFSSGASLQLAPESKIRRRW